MTVNFKYSAQIDRPVETVCAAVSDLRRMADWLSVKEIRHVSGPVALGARFQVITEVVGRERVMDFTVTSYEPCRKFVYTSTGKYPTTITMTLNPQQAGTHLTFEFNMQIGGLAAAAVKTPIRRQTENDLNRLVEILENE